MSDGQRLREGGPGGKEGLKAVAELLKEPESLPGGSVRGLC